MPKEVKAADNANGEKPKLKPCCVCLDTKRVRDEWYVASIDNLKLVLKKAI